MVVSKFGSKVWWCPGIVVMVPMYHGILRYGGLVVSMVVSKYGSDGTMVY